MAVVPPTLGMFPSLLPHHLYYKIADALRSKGSMSFKSSNSRRESITRRAAMRLGGLRVITAGGVSSGIDAALYLVSALVSEEAALEAARLMCWQWQRGVVVDGLDV